MSALWPNGRTSPGDVWHEYGPRKPIQTPNGPTSSFHGGIDIGPWDGAGGTWLLAPDAGTVTHAGYDDIFGNRVIVRCGNVDFWLCHGRPGSMQVRVGQRVTQGQRLQLMGETGKASGVHVHFEVHVNGQRVDPRAFYRSGAITGSTVSPQPTQEEEEMTASYINVTGTAGSRRGGCYAIMRSNPPESHLFARFVSPTPLPGVPTISGERELKEWDATLTGLK